MNFNDYISEATRTFHDKVADALFDNWRLDDLTGPSFKHLSSWHSLTGQDKKDFEEEVFDIIAYATKNKIKDPEKARDDFYEYGESHADIREKLKAHGEHKRRKMN